jgi:hypothetical protein
VKDMESFVYHPSKSFQLVLSSVIFEEGLSVNLRGAATVTINELVGRPGVSNVEFKQSPLMNNDVRGILMEGSYHENEVFLHFQYAVYCRHSIMWRAWVSFHDSDLNGKKIANRMMESVEINYSVKSI